MVCDGQLTPVVYSSLFATYSCRCLVQHAARRRFARSSRTYGMCSIFLSLRRFWGWNFEHGMFFSEMLGVAENPVSSASLFAYRGVRYDAHACSATWCFAREPF